MAHFASLTDSHAAVSAQIALMAARSARAVLKEEADERQRNLEGLDTETRLGLSAKDPPAVVLGLLAGVRLHGDPNMPNAVDARGNTLYYQGARPKVSAALAEWGAAGVRGAVSLGNVVDRCNGAMRTRGCVEQALATFAELKSHSWRWRLSHEHTPGVLRASVLHLPGEHDLEHTTAEELAALMGFAPYAPGAPAGRRYHCIDSRAGWRLLFLDTLDVAVSSPDLAKREEARALLERQRRQGHDANVAGGAVGQEQLAWLRRELTVAAAAEDRAVVFSYAPLSAALARQGDPALVCWNHKEVLAALLEHPGLVPLCLSGQQLLGGCACDDRAARGEGRIHHVGLRAVLATPDGGRPGATLALFRDRVELSGAVSATFPCHAPQRGAGARAAGGGL